MVIWKWFAFLQLLSIIYTKTYSKQIPIRQFRREQWVYVTKFGSHIGQSTYHASLRFVNTHGSNFSIEETANINLNVYLDERWESVLEMDPCERKTKASVVHNLNVSLSSDAQSTTASTSLTQSIRQHLWFFVIEDCSKEIYNRFKDRPGNVRLEVNIQITNTGGSEFSSEESGIIYLEALLSLANTIIFVYLIIVAQKDYKKNEEIDWPLMILIVAIGIEMMHTYIYLIHLISYASDGIGIIPMQIISDIFQVLSRFTLTTLIILMSWGWAINYITIENFDIFIPLGLMVGVIQMMIMGLGKLTDDYHSKYHQFDGWVGYVICVIEIGLYVYFYFGIRQTKQKANEIVKSFISAFAFYAQLYMLCFPIMLVISKILAPYLRLKFIIGGTSITRMIAILLLAHLFTSKKSGFHNISYKNQTFLDRCKSD